jgi:hypothetical protein
LTKWLVAHPSPMAAGAREFDRIEWTIPERPLLHACSNSDKFGDCRIDNNPSVKPDIVADVTKPLPLRDNSMAAWIADAPWTASFKPQVANMMRELMRVAPVGYLLSPWTYGAAWIRITDVKVAWMPGVNQALLFSRYERVQNWWSK